MTASRYQNSIEFLQRAEATIPLGSQTFSKSRTQYPVGVSPLFIDRAKGSYVWDLDGNRYIDLVNSLAAITLGYNNKHVNRAVSRQLKKGTLFSLPGVLETEVAEQIVELVPSAEMVRFAKNGTDATSAAIRLARAYTGRDHVIFCGYHGWQDWFVGATTKNKGVPQAVSMLTHKFNYNDLESLTNLFSAFPNQIAAVILEPMNSTYPKQGFLEGVRDLTQKNGAVLIFDEVITGFRVSPGGAQGALGISPDLTILGKALANGFAVAAIVGKKEFMNLVGEGKVIHAGTYNTQSVSMAATIATLELIKSGKPHQKIDATGSALMQGLAEEFTKAGVVHEIVGYPSVFNVRFDLKGPTDYRSGIKANTVRYGDFAFELLKSGIRILPRGTWFLSSAHEMSDIDKTLNVVRDVLKKGI